MPNKDAAKKYMRVSARKGARNASLRSQIDNLRRKFQKALGTKNSSEATDLYGKLQKALDAAARHNVVHPNTAARTKSRLSSALQKINA